MVEGEREVLAADLEPLPPQQQQRDDLDPDLAPGPDPDADANIDIDVDVDVNPDDPVSNKRLKYTRDAGPDTAMQESVKNDEKEKKDNEGAVVLLPPPVLDGTRIDEDPLKDDLPAVLKSVETLMTVSQSVKSALCFHLFSLSDRMDESIHQCHGWMIPSFIHSFGKKNEFQISYPHLNIETT